MSATFAFQLFLVLSAAALCVWVAWPAGAEGEEPGADIPDGDE